MNRICFHIQEGDLLVYHSNEHYHKLNENIDNATSWRIFKNYSSQYHGKILLPHCLFHDISRKLLLSELAFSDHKRKYASITNSKQLKSFFLM